MESKIILTVLGMLLAALISISRRNRRSVNSPRKFNLRFYLTDTWGTHLISILTSLVLVLIYHYMGLDVWISKKIVAMGGTEEGYDFFERFSAFVCGFAPHLGVALLNNITRIFSPSRILQDGTSYKRK